MKKPWYEIKAQGARASIYLYGDIVSSKWDEDEVSANSFIEELDAVGASDIDLYINSQGGAIFPAAAIYNAIRRHDAEVIAHIDGIAASSASMIAMAADVVEMADNALFMIHDPWALVMVAGNAEDVRKAADQTARGLDAAKDAMITAYGRSNLSESDISDAMASETWYTAEQALTAGFVDAVFKGQQAAASIQPGRFMFRPIIQATGENLMPKPTTEPAGDPKTVAKPDQTEPNQTVANVADIEAAAEKRALEKDAARRSAIGDIFARFPEQSELLARCQNDIGCDIQAAREQLLNALGKEATPVGGAHRIETGEDERDKFRGAVVAGIVARALRKPQEQNELRHVGFRALAARSLEFAGMNRRDLDKMRPMGLVGLAITHSTSDYPNILQDAMHKLIVSNYQAQPNTYRTWCRIGDVSDFRGHNRLKMGSFNNLATVNEAGEYESGTLPDAEKEVQTATTKGREVRISRQMLVNDDMGAFQTLGAAMGRAAGRTVESDVYVLLASNPTMSDAAAFFVDAGHKNLAGAAAAPSVVTLAAAEDAMRSQTDTGGNEKLDIRPYSFVGSLGYARTAQETYGSEFAPETTGSRATRRRNALFGTIPDDRIVGTPYIATNDWYLFADPMEAPACEVAFLDGVDTPFIDEMESSNPDGVRLLVRLDYGVAMIDWRGAYKHPA